MTVEPKFLLLTIERVTQMVPGQRPGMPSQAQVTVLQPTVQRLMPLALISPAREQNGERTEITIEAAGVVLTGSERFVDVLEAMEAAAREGRYIVRPAQRARIEEAVAAAVGAGADRPSLSVVPQVAEAQKPVRKPVPGDLRISWNNGMMTGGGGFWCVQHYRVDEDSNGEWISDGLVPELRRPFASEEAAEHAIAVAGYSRRLLKGA